MNDAMKKFRIVSEAGLDMGVYEGTDADQACDAMARDAGYESMSVAECEFGQFFGKVTEVLS